MPAVTCTAAAARVDPAGAASTPPVWVSVPAVVRVPALVKVAGVAPVPAPRVRNVPAPKLTAVPAAVVKSPSLSQDADAWVKLRFPPVTFTVPSLTTEPAITCGKGPATDEVTEMVPVLVKTPAVTTKLLVPPTQPAAAR